MTRELLRALRGWEPFATFKVGESGEEADQRTVGSYTVRTVFSSITRIRTMDFGESKGEQKGDDEEFPKGPPIPFEKVDGNIRRVIDEMFPQD